MIIEIMVIALLVLFGIILSFGKGSFLIAGYNTSSKEEREKINEKALCKFMGKAMFGIAFSVFLWVLSDILSMEWLFTCGMICFFAIIIFILAYANTGNHFKK